MPDLETVTIGSTDFTVYAAPETVDTYALGSINADAWRDAELENKQRGTVTGTRVIDRQMWQGRKTDPAQENEFPRTGLKDKDGNDVPSDSIPQQVVDAACELDIALMDGSAVETQGTTESDVSMLKAGSVEIQFWRGTGLPPERFPRIVDELIGLWLAPGTSGAATTAESFGTCGVSQTRSRYGLTEGF